jgi:hypothetical protein
MLAVVGRGRGGGRFLLCSLLGSSLSSSTASSSASSSRSGSSRSGCSAASGFASSGFANRCGSGSGSGNGEGIVVTTDCVDETNGDKYFSAVCRIKAIGFVVPGSSDVTGITGMSNISTISEVEGEVRYSIEADNTCNVVGFVCGGFTVIIADLNSTSNSDMSIRRS